MEHPPELLLLSTWPFFSAAAQRAQVLTWRHGSRDSMSSSARWTESGDVTKARRRALCSARSATCRPDSAGPIGYPQPRVGLSSPKHQRSFSDGRVSVGSLAGDSGPVGFAGPVRRALGGGRRRHVG